MWAGQPAHDLVTVWSLRVRTAEFAPTVRSMPVEFLTDDEAAAYGRYAGVPSQADLERVFFLDEEDRKLVDLRRGDHMKAGFAPAGGRSGKAGVGPGAVAQGAAAARERPGDHQGAGPGGGDHGIGAGRDRGGGAGAAAAAGRAGQVRDDRGCLAGPPSPGRPPGGHLAGHGAAPGGPVRR